MLTTREHNCFYLTSSEVARARILARKSYLLGPRIYYAECTDHINGKKSGGYSSMRFNKS